MGGAYHIALGFDQNYLCPFYALADSLQALHGDGDLVVHAMVSGVSEADKEDIVRFLATRHNRIIFYEPDQALVDRFVLLNKWTGAVYYRLFLPLMVPPSVSRLLYLDTDIIAVRPLHDLFGQPLNGQAVGAVADNYVGTQPLIGITEEGEYFNSGVLLIDIPAWKKQLVTEKAIDYLNRYPDRIRFVDQCALNAVLQRQWYKMPGVFNAIYSRIPQEVPTRVLRSEFLPAQYLIHFTLNRPWEMLSKNPFNYLYRQHLKRTPYGQRRKVIIDFEWAKVPAWCRLRLIQWYVNQPLLSSLWRTIKGVVTSQS